MQTITFTPRKVKPELNVHKDWTSVLGEVLSQISQGITNVGKSEEWIENNRMKAKEWGTANITTVRERSLRWNKENPEKANEKRKRYLQRKVSQTPPDITKEELDRMKRLTKIAKEISDVTGVSHHVDHIIPLIKGGVNALVNLQIITGTHNQKKGYSIEN